MSRQCEILLIDDHDATRETLTEVLESAGHVVVPAENQARAIEALETRSFDLILTDLKLPDGSGMQILERAKLLSPTTPVVMITGHATIENAVEATRLGAYEYLTKPVDLNKLRVIVKNALHLAELERRVEQVSALDALVGQSRPMMRLKELIRQVAQTDVTVLIQGESGTGKELIANAIQSLSPRKDGPYIKVNVAALSPDLIESELFGHEKGAFSGAIRQRKGRFELADGGTLFLDEIGEMKLELQVKLLRVLQEHEFERVGGTETLPIHIRLIAATNMDLKKQVAEGKFREDLYFRINVLRIDVPPLRERREDIPLLAEHFLRKYGARYGIEKTLSPEALSQLMVYDWPGNVRELENAMESALVRCVGPVIQPEHLPEEITGMRPPTPLEGLPSGIPLAELEKRYILSELARCGGNKSQAAKSLGIGLKTLYRKLEEYGVFKGEEQSEEGS